MRIYNFPIIITALRSTNPQMQNALAYKLRMSTTQDRGIRYTSVGDINILIKTIKR